MPYSTHKALAALLLCTAAPAALAHGARDAWTDRAARPADASALQPAAARSLDLDIAKIYQFVDNDAARGTALSLPLPEGGYADFVLEDAGTMDPALAAKFPEIRSLRGRDAAGNAVRVNLSSLGFQAMVFDRDGGSYVVEPETFGGSAYLAFRRDAVAANRDFRCDVHGDHAESATDTPPRLWDAPQPNTVTGTKLRNMRTVVAATGEYTAVFGGTVANGQAAIVTAMNRVNQIYEAEFSVHMTLVANNNLVVYTDALTDPYTNNNGSTMLGQNQTNLTAVIGAANYDIGHVFSTGGGGVAGLGVICGTSKARGVTGSSNPVGDAFWVDYVAHEMGHQYGGDHTFNSTTSSCGGNRVSGSAYETGSGSTIMAYAGICGSDDLQPNSDPYFHARSLDQINARLNATTCGTITNNPNAVPVIPAMTTAYVIPAKTPYALTAPTATDADGDTLTYDWEEYDLGSATTVGIDNGTSPIARSFNPSTSPTRRIPRQANLVANTFAKGEVLPQIARTAMKYRLTVRDNHPGGGTTVSADLPAIRVVATSAPFAVTAPNTAVSWMTGTAQTVTWNVGDTNAAPISCASVDVTLSTDGGATFPTPLALAAANTGSAAIVVPTGTATSSARVRVKCTTNIFFDISNANFTIVQSSLPDLIFADDFDPAATAD
jgi:hypothetical protein